MRPACEHSYPRCADCEREQLEHGRDGITPECRWIAAHSPTNGRERDWIDEWPVVLYAVAWLALAALLKLRLTVRGRWT